MKDIAVPLKLLETRKGDVTKAIGVKLGEVELKQKADVPWSTCCT